MRHIERGSWRGRKGAVIAKETGKVLNIIRKCDHGKDISINSSSKQKIVMCSKTNQDNFTSVKVLTQARDRATPQERSKGIYIS